MPQSQPTFLAFSSSRHPRHAGAARGGLTLLELILVLALLVAVGAIVSPRLFKSYARQKLSHGGEILRAAFNEARIEAMRAGKIQTLTCELDSGDFLVRPWEAGGDDGANARRAVAGDAMSESNESGSQPVDEPVGRSRRKKLPEGLRIVACESLSSKRSRAIEDMDPTFGEPDGANATPVARPVLFYADGSTSDSQAIVADDHGDAVVVRLRGLTGSSSVGEVRPLSELIGE